MQPATVGSGTTRRRADPPRRPGTGDLRDPHLDQAPRCRALPWPAGTGRLRTAAWTAGAQAHFRRHLERHPRRPTGTDGAGSIGAVGHPALAARTALSASLPGHADLRSGGRTRFCVDPPRQTHVSALQPGAHACRTPARGRPGRASGRAIGPAAPPARATAWRRAVIQGRHLPPPPTLAALPGGRAPRDDAPIPPTALRHVTRPRAPPSACVTAAKPIDAA